MEEKVKRPKRVLSVADNIRFLIVYDVPSFSPKRSTMYRRLMALNQAPVYLTKSVMATSDEETAIKAGEIVEEAGGDYVVFKVERVVSTNI